MEKRYGRSHEDAKQEKLLRSFGEPRKCIVTGKTTHLEEHHVVPRFLGGPDSPSNYMTLETEFHKFLHYICNVTRSKLVGERIHISRKLNNCLLDEEKTRTLIRELDKVDSSLIPEYIHNMVYHLPDDVVHTVVFHTLVSCFKTIRDMRIRIMQLDLQHGSMPA